MKIEQQVIIKVIDIEKDDTDISCEDGLDFGIENDELSVYDEGFLRGYFSS